MYIYANSVNVYSSAYALIDDNTTSAEYESVLRSLPTDEGGNYAHALGILENLEDDYETYHYILLDYKHVVMVFDGEIVREWETVSDFIKETIEEVQAVIAGENE